ncbi:MAG: EamA family transporter [Alphaproteobacteria bacterium]|nr:EamA family transporter [Alphaproteobacteria bacterium]
MFVLVIALFAPFFYSFANIIECKLSNNIFKHPVTMIFYISLMNCLFLPLLLIFGLPTLVSPFMLLIYLILAVIDVMYLFPYYKAMKEIDTSIVSALFSLGQITIPVLTYFLLDEKLNIFQYIGFGIIIFASVVLSINDFYGLKLNKAFYYMVGVSLLRAFYVVLEKYAFNYDSSWINMVIYVNAMSSLLPFLFLFDKKHNKMIKSAFNEYRKNTKIFCVNELFCFLGATCCIYGLSQLSAVVSSAINATAPIFLLIISLGLEYVFGIKVKETITPLIMAKKVICYALIIVGVVMVSL